MVRRIGLQQATQGGDDVPPLQGHPGLSDASEGTGVPESRGEVGVQDPEHHDGARDTRWRDDRMTGRRSHGRLSALNGVVHQGISAPGLDISRRRSLRARAARAASHRVGSRGWVSSCAALRFGSSVTPAVRRLGDLLSQSLHESGPPSLRCNGRAEPTWMNCTRNGRQLRAPSASPRSAAHRPRRLGSFSSRFRAPESTTAGTLFRAAAHAQFRAVPRSSSRRSPRAGPTEPMQFMSR